MSLASFYNRLATMIASVRTDHPVRVAVDGIDAAGKTTLANALVKPLSRLGREVIRASIDGFHHPKRLRHMRGKDSPAGYYYDSFDYEAVILRLLKPLGPAGDRLYRTSVFDHTTDTELTSYTMTASENAILIFDGVFLLRPELNRYWNLRIFVNVSIEVARERAVSRLTEGGNFAGSGYSGTTKLIEASWSWAWEPRSDSVCNRSFFVKSLRSGA